MCASQAVLAARPPVVVGDVFCGDPDPGGLIRFFRVDDICGRDVELRELLVQVKQGKKNPILRPYRDTYKPGSTRFASRLLWTDEDPDDTYWRKHSETYPYFQTPYGLLDRSLFPFASGRAQPAPAAPPPPPPRPEPERPAQADQQSRDRIAALEDENRQLRDQITSLSTEIARLKAAAAAKPVANLSTAQNVRRAVKQSFGVLSRKFHPDLGGSAEKQVVVNACFAELNSRIGSLLQEQ